MTLVIWGHEISRIFSADVEIPEGYTKKATLLTSSVIASNGKLEAVIKSGIRFYLLSPKTIDQIGPADQWWFDLIYEDGYKQGFAILGSSFIKDGPDRLAGMYRELLTELGIDIPCTVDQFNPNDLYWFLIGRSEISSLEEFKG